jgi:hypothetical protein
LIILLIFLMNSADDLMPLRAFGRWNNFFIVVVVTLDKEVFLS